MGDSLPSRIHRMPRAQQGRPLRHSESGFVDALAPTPIILRPEFLSHRRTSLATRNAGGEVRAGRSRLVRSFGQCAKSVTILGHEPKPELYLFLDGGIIRGH